MKEANTVYKNIYRNILTYLVTSIDKTDPRNASEREDYWIYTLKTKACMGLNM